MSSLPRGKFDCFDARATYGSLTDVMTVSNQNLPSDAEREKEDFRPFPRDVPLNMSYVFAERSL